jgi:catechol 2,3-dioxygenase-like lactoylglutathione lyase family enzyme
MILGLHHAQITIPKGSEDEARAFYCSFLNLPELEKPDALKSRCGFWLQVGDRQVHVGTEDGFDRLTTKAHLAYEVSDLSEWTARLRAAGFDLPESVPIPGFTRLEFRDPFENRVELIQQVS